MFAPLSVQRLKEARLVPAAMVKAPPRYFQDLGVQFAEGEDGFDRYAIAGLALGALTFGLLRYAASPFDGTTVLLPEGIPAGPEQIMPIAEAFALPLADFVWEEPSLDRYRFRT